MSGAFSSLRSAKSSALFRKQFITWRVKGQEVSGFRFRVSAATMRSEREREGERGEKEWVRVRERSTVCVRERQGL